MKKMTLLVALCCVSAGLSAKWGGNMFGPNGQESMQKRQQLDLGAVNTAWQEQKRISMDLQEKALAKKREMKAKKDQRAQEQWNRLVERAKKAKADGNAELHEELLNQLNKKYWKLQMKNNRLQKMVEKTAGFAGFGAAAVSNAIQTKEAEGVVADDQDDDDAEDEG